MNTKNQVHSSVHTQVMLGSILIVFALIFSAYIGNLLEEQALVNYWQRYLVQGLLMSGIVIPGVMLLQSQWPQKSWKNLGFSKPKDSFLHFGLGLLLILFPFVTTLLITQISGWASIEINMSLPILEAHLIGIITVILFEAVPEELIFRGFIFGRLKEKYSLKMSALLSIVLFVLLPILAFPIQRYVLGMTFNIGSSTYITFGYLINMLVFGSFVMYLRVISGSIWLGVGFHFMFVYINRLLGMADTNIIQLSSFANELPMQITLISTVILVLLGLALYPRFTKRKVFSVS